MNIENKGRVNIEGPNIDVLFSMKDRILIEQPSSFRDALTGIFEETPLSQAFFSEKNIQIIQNAIRAGVYHKSKGEYVIAPQDYDIIKTIMRSIFLQHSLNLQGTLRWGCHVRALQRGCENQHFGRHRKIPHPA